jgi:hypothetical protein
MPLKLFLVVLAVMLPLNFASATFQAGGTTKKCAHLGYCPKGTCAKDGGKRACNIKNCRKQNCPG